MSNVAVQTKHCFFLQATEKQQANRAIRDGGEENEDSEWSRLVSVWYVAHASQGATVSYKFFLIQVQSSLCVNDSNLWKVIAGTSSRWFASMPDLNLNENWHDTHIFAMPTESLLQLHENNTNVQLLSRILRVSVQFKGLYAAAPVWLLGILPSTGTG